MNQEEISQQERFTRVVAFADAHAEDFPAKKPAGAQVEVLRAVLGELATLSATQTGSGDAARAATARKAASLDSVRADLVGMAKTARALSDENPGLALQFRLPDSSRDDALLASARAQLALLKDGKSGAALVTLFTDYGMADDFVADLEADIVAADAANDAQDTHGGARREDTLSIDTQIEAGTRATAKLDAFCDNRYRDDAALLGAWKSASRLEVRRVRPRKPTPPAP